MSDNIVWKPETVYVTYIVTTPEKVWEAITSPEFTRQYFFGRRVESEWKLGSIVRYWQENGTLDVQGKVLQCVPPRLLSFTWHVGGWRNSGACPTRWLRFKSINWARSCG